jgi:Icc-related predicted phosphoesterase
MKIIAIGDFHEKFPEKLRRKILKERPDLILSTGDYAGGKEWRPLLKRVWKERAKGRKIEIEDLIGKKKYKELLERDYKNGKKPIQELNKFKIPVLSVFGNGDWYKDFFNKSKRDYSIFINRLNNINNINRACGNFKGIKIAGFGGYLDPDIYFTKKGKTTICEDEGTCRERISRRKKEKSSFMKIMKFKPDIVLSHYTPYEILDKMDCSHSLMHRCHMGISLFNIGIKKYKPVLFICGHMHENQGRERIGKTLVVNPGSASEGKMAIIDFDEVKKKVRRVRFIK